MIDEPKPPLSSTALVTISSAAIWHGDQSARTCGLTSLRHRPVGCGNAISAGFCAFFELGLGQSRGF